jgi:hypothetical protein
MPAISIFGTAAMAAMACLFRMACSPPTTLPAVVVAVEAQALSTPQVPGARRAATMAFRLAAMAGQEAAEPAGLAATIVAEPAGQAQTPVAEAEAVTT